MSSCTRTTTVLVLILLWQTPRARANCDFIGKVELNHDLDSKSLLPNCNELGELHNFFIFPEEVNNVDVISVCYYGTNTTSLVDVDKLQAYLVVFVNFQETRSKEYFTLLPLIQSIQQAQTPVLQKTKICETFNLVDLYNATLSFGVYIPEDCIVNKQDEKICPLKLDFFSNSSSVVHGTTLDVISLSLGNLENNFLVDHDADMEEVCLDLNIRIIIPVTATCSYQETSLKHSSSSCSLADDSSKCSEQKNDGISLTIIVLGIFLGIVSIFVLNAVVVVVCYSQRRKAVSATGGLPHPHTCGNTAELNTYCGTGPSTSNYNPKNVVAHPHKDTHDYEELYFVPASKEKELVTQIKKLGVAEISRANKSLRLFEVLGSGAFGTVHRGMWLHSGSSSRQQLVEKEVAVKSMDGMASEDDRVKFLQEAAIMGQFNHPNIITILGIVPDIPMMILIEIMKTGDLRNHILDIKTKSINCPVPNELPPTLLSYSRQVACGMVYLSLKEFVHRDLAARNILVSDNGTCKIADFGMSRDLQYDTYYKSHGGMIPIKWTAPEALYYHKYSTASDIWSYGCVLYEIWSLGYKPFHDDSNAEFSSGGEVEDYVERWLISGGPPRHFNFLQLGQSSAEKAMMKVSSGFRMPPPPGCSRDIYDIMIQCWNPEATQRPTFFDVTVSLQKPDFMLLHWSVEEENMCKEDARTLGSPLEAGHQLHMDLQKTYLAGPEQVTSWPQDKVNFEPSQQQATENSKPTQHQEKANTDPSQKQDEEDKQKDNEHLYMVLESNSEVEENCTEITVEKDDCTL